MINIQFITANSWSKDDLGITDGNDEIINHLVSVNIKGINLYIGEESGKIYDLWLEE